eukprot:Colp12_sorted_trinity150504_noHs@25169
MAIDPADLLRFTNEQAVALNKACLNKEVPPKVKHIRTAIVMSWTHQGSEVFWNVYRKMPLGAQAITCWKALIVLHKLLHDGHPNVLKEIYKNKKDLESLMTAWSNRKEKGPYNPLITFYVEFLLFKLDFHNKYPSIPGTLNSEDFILARVARVLESTLLLQSDIINYQDALLYLGDQIIASVKGITDVDILGCRLSALVPVVTESASLYKMAFDVLTKLHKGMKFNELHGQRERFADMLSRLKKFYFVASGFRTLQGLVNFPLLPESCPEFTPWDGKSPFEEGEAAASAAPEPEAPAAAPIPEDLAKLVAELRERSRPRRRLTTALSPSSELKLLSWSSISSKRRPRCRL